MIPLRQSTASQVVWLGPFIDTAGAAVTGLSIANTDIKLRLYPDQATFLAEEQRRFELLDAHWDVPLVELPLDHG